MVAGCSGDPDGSGNREPVPNPVGDSGMPSTAVPSVCSEGLSCRGDVEVTRTCVAGEAHEVERDCAPQGQVCQLGVGCAACRPGSGKCDGSQAQVCRPDGSGFDVQDECDLAIGEVCSDTDGGCLNLCAEAEASHSYIGCEYWPTPALNSQLDPEFEFAVAIANPQRVPAQVTVRLGATMLAQAEVAPGALETVTLPWIVALKGVSQEERSALVTPGAYRLQSNVPVTVYQFNPLEYRIEQDCVSEHLVDVPDAENPQIDGQCFSYSNDASLLLPTHVLTGDYMVVSRSTMLNRIETAQFDLLAKSPGFFAVVGVEAREVQVQVTVTAHVIASVDGAVAALAPGEQGSFTLAQGDVLQIVADAPTECGTGPQDTGVDPNTNQIVEIRTYCEVGPEYDLTGSEVHADGKLAVISGHNCGFVPFDRWACDHQEEAIFPLQAWGQDYLVAMTEPLRDEPNIVRVVSGADGNQIHFDPAVAADVTLDHGAILEFEVAEDFRVTGTGALLVAQFLVGQDYAGIATAGAMGLGDPSLSLAVPTEQFRRSYSVLAPATFVQNYVNVIAPVDGAVEIDGEPITGFQPVGSTGMATARVAVDPGQHELSSSDFFGVVSYGFGTYTSYMVPGGLDLTPINTVE